MQIAIIGNGNVGSGLAGALSRTAHEVALLGHESDIATGVTTADVVILATPYVAAQDIAGRADLTGKIVIDVSNPVAADFSGLQIGHDTSAAEEIQKLAPGARVVKAFNTVFAQHYGAGLKIADRPIQTFVATDDAQAGETVRGLAAEIGLEPVDAGPLRNARYLEPMGFMNIQFGYVLGKGADIAPQWLAA